MDHITIAALCASSSALILGAGTAHIAYRRLQAKEIAKQACPSADGPKVALIQPVPVVRDETGCWWHPDMPDFDEGDGDKYEAWIKEQGLETTHDRLEDEPDENLVSKSYYEDGDPDFRGWTPKPPEGAGWFPLCIGDTEDGPIWCWARHKEGGAA